MVFNHIILAFLWIVYCVLHSVLASLGVKTAVRKKAPRFYRYYRLFYTVFAALSLAGILFYQLRLSSVNVFATTSVSAIAGALVAALGLGIMLICIKKYFFSLSGLKSLFQEAPSAELMIAGIHRYMRHPLYLGTFLFIWGLWLLFPTLSLFIANAIITGYTLYAIRLEEKKLVLEFGPQYKEYQKTVPMLLPRF